MATKPIIYIDGKYKPVHQEVVQQLSPGVLKGLGVFDTLLCDQGHLYFVSPHYRRFVYGCDRYILPQPPRLGQVKEIIQELANVNQIQTGRVRIMAWRNGSQTHFAVVMIKSQIPAPGVYTRGFSACVYPKPLNRHMNLSRIKSLDYKFFLRAFEFANKCGVQEALLVNSWGHVVEGSRTNLFFVRENKLFTPSIKSGCLAGVSRQAVLDLAKSLGIKTQQGIVTRQDLFTAKEVFLTNALLGLMPLTALEGKCLGVGRAGPVTERLASAFKKLSRQDSISLV